MASSVKAIIHLTVKGVDILPGLWYKYVSSQHIDVTKREQTPLSAGRLVMRRRAPKGGAIVPVTALVVRRGSVLSDPILRKGGRGTRKLVVTMMRQAEEQEADTPEWAPPAASERSSVLLAENWECSEFDEYANQERHRHTKRTEMYLVLSGQMGIEVEGKEYILGSGDLIIILPGTAHLVYRFGQSFLCFTATMNCGGAEDKLPRSYRGSLAPPSVPGTRPGRREGFG